MNYRELRAKLAPLYGEGEARAMADCLLEDAFGLSRADVLCGAVERLSPADSVRLEQMVARLLNFEPLQYVVGYTIFKGRRFKTATGALIPRPETEELCTWITHDNATLERPNILDIGTGTGCIACTLALDIPQSSVSALDISKPALAIAAENAKQLGVNITLSEQDILTKSADTALWNIIVSNPPYVCINEQSAMSPNVLRHEPHIALFVPDDAPLLFYRAIANYALTALKPQGRIYFEINPLYANELTSMLTSLGFKDVTIKKDMFGKERMLSSLTPALS